METQENNSSDACPTCGSDCNVHDELFKAEREIDRLNNIIQVGAKVFAHESAKLDMFCQFDFARIVSGGHGESIAILIPIDTWESIKDCVKKIAKPWTI